MYCTEGVVASYFKWLRECWKSASRYWPLTWTQQQNMPSLPADWHIMLALPPPGGPCAHQYTACTITTYVHSDVPLASYAEVYYASTDMTNVLINGAYQFLYHLHNFGNWSTLLDMALAVCGQKLKETNSMWLPYIHIRKVHSNKNA